MDARESQVFLAEVPTDFLPAVLPVVCVVVQGGVGDDDGLSRGGARVYRHGC